MLRFLSFHKFAQHTHFIPSGFGVSILAKEASLFHDMYIQELDLKFYIYTEDIIW